MVLLSLVAIAGVVATFLWHYVWFTRKLPPLSATTGRFAHGPKRALTRPTLKGYLARHRVSAIVYGVALAVFLAMFGVGVVNAKSPPRDTSSTAADSQQPNASAAASDEPSTAPTSTGEPSASPAAPSAKPTTQQAGGSGRYTATCPAYPAFPDEYCTGWKHTGVTLRNCDSQTDKGYIWDDGKTFDSCYFSKTLTIKAAKVTITRSQIHGNISTHWSNSYDFRGLTLIDVEIEDQGNPQASKAAIGGHNFSCTRCNVHHTGTGIHFGDNSVVRDSYTHDFNYTPEAHGSGVAAGQGTGSNAKIIHNNIQCNRLAGQPTICSSALSIYPETNQQGGTVHNVLVEKNLFNTTGAYCVYAGGLPATNIDFIDNHFGKKFTKNCAGYGPVASYQSAGGKWINNVWADGSGPVVP